MYKVVPTLSQLVAGCHCVGVERVKHTPFLPPLVLAGTLLPSGLQARLKGSVVG